MRDFLNRLESDILVTGAAVAIISIGLFVLLFFVQIITSVHGVAGVILATFTILISVLVSGIMGRREYKKKLLISNTSKRSE